ncbi:MAG TPA: hypothetical protein ENK75_07545 [Saprospiraceae bacterium]|nr:hypothetical protein [Saprospiraceae bacterium]
MKKYFYLFVIFLFVAIHSQAQTFYLKDIVLGNSYDPTNKTFVWKANKYCPYNWSMRVVKADYLGGILELYASPGTKPDCQSIYKISWNFNKDIRQVNCGEKVYIDVENIPISKKDCGIFLWEGDMNPSSITILASSGVGESSLVYKERSQDPKSSYRDYIFLHFPGQIVQGEPYPNPEGFPNWHLHNARLVLDICARKDFANEANGGSFTFRIGNRGISFDVVYLYSKKAVIINPKTTLQIPVIEHNKQNSEGTYWMSIKVPGTIQGYNGKQIQLVIRFVDEQGNFLSGNSYDFRYVDGSGKAATGSGLINVTTGNFDLGNLQLWMPYYALNLPNTGGKKLYNIRAFAELYVDGKMLSQSQYTSFQVKW